MTPLLLISDVARRLRCKDQTVREYIRNGRLRAIRIGREYRIDEQWVLDFEAAAVVAPMQQPTFARLIRALAVEREQKSIFERAMELGG